MFDGITIKYEIENFADWKRSLNISFGSTVDIDSAEIKTKKREEDLITTHRAKWETFNLIVKEVMNISTGKESYHLTMRGSLHKNHFGGANYLPFTWDKLQEQINHITKTLCIKAKQAKISTLEIGLNICTPFEVLPFIRHNVIDYKGKSFNSYESGRDGISLGRYCKGTQFKIKMYDKGLQNNLLQNSMRFEVKHFVMQSLNDKITNKIKFLSDLQDVTKVYSLKAILLNAWNDVLIYDVPGNVKDLSLKQHEIDLLIEGNSSNFWERLKESNARDHFKYLRAKFKKLVAIHGNNWHTTVNDLLKNEWENLFKNYPNLRSGKNHFLPVPIIKIKNKNGQKEFVSSLITYSQNKQVESWDYDINEMEKYFKKIKIPVRPIMLNQCSTITNVPLFIQSHIDTLKANNGNKTFISFLHRLQKLKSILEMEAVKKFTVIKL